MSILECVANFSEGCDPRIISAVADAASSSGATIADLHSDPDHNRSVVTLIASAKTLVSGMVEATRVAAELIDLRSHSGAHPRLGAMDVVPFVPVAGSSMEEATRAAETTAGEIGKASIPAFLYEHASPNGTSLPDVRKRAFTTLFPDYGPHHPHRTAGAVCVGARSVLVAYNINLESDDVSYAKEIATEIRQSGGGLGHVRAIGLRTPVAGGTQVSINLTRPEVTTLSDVFKAVEDAARARGIAISSSEIVGLAPKKSLGGLSAESLKLKGGLRFLEDLF